VAAPRLALNPDGAEMSKTGTARPAPNVGKTLFQESSDPEGYMRRLFRLWRLSGQDLRLLFMVLQHPNRPRWLIPAAIAIACFAFEPFNFAIPVIGVVDDLLVLPLLLHALVKFAVSALEDHVGPRSRDASVVSVQ
jgi:uncharacterized membrane protein YkvA (DUF1232 family)